MMVGSDEHGGRVPRNLALMCFMGMGNDLEDGWEREIAFRKAGGPKKASRVEVSPGDAEFLAMVERDREAEREWRARVQARFADGMAAWRASNPLPETLDEAERIAEEWSNTNANGPTYRFTYTPATSDVPLPPSDYMAIREQRLNDAFHFCGCDYCRQLLATCNCTECVEVRSQLVNRP